MSIKIRAVFFAAILFLAACSGNKNNDKTGYGKDFELALAALKKAGLLDTTNNQFNRLVEQCRKDTVNGIPALFEATGKTLNVKLRLPSLRQVAESYAAYHRAIAAKFPVLQCDSVNMNYFIADTETQDTISTTLQLFKKQQVYTRDLGSGYLPYSRNVKDSLSRRLDPDFWKIYNRLLTEENSKERLFCITYRYNYENDPKITPIYREDPERIALVMLNEQQYDLLKTIPGMGWEYNEFELVSFEKCNNWITKLKSAGLYKADSLREKEKRAELEANSLYSKQDFFDFFDSLFTTVSFDTLNDIDPYTTMYQNLNTISGGKLNMLVYTEDADSNFRNVSLGYKVADSTYVKMYHSQNGLHDLNAFEDLNLIIRERKREADGLFYVVNNTENAVTVIYAAPALADKIKATGLFDQFSEKVPEFLWQKYLPGSR